MRKINRIILHHSSSDRDTTTFHQVNDWHKLRWPNFISKLGFHVGYNYLIGHNWITQARLVEEVGAHTYGHNEDSIGICLTGNFEDDNPNEYQLEELKKLLTGLMVDHKLTEDDIYLHRDLTATACPGKNIDKGLIHFILNTSAPFEIVDPISDTEPHFNSKFNMFKEDLLDLLEDYE